MGLAVAGTITVEGLEISGKLNPYRSSYSVIRSSWNQSYTKEAGDNRLLNSRSSVHRRLKFHLLYLEFFIG